MWGILRTIGRGAGVAVGLPVIVTAIEHVMAGAPGVQKKTRALDLALDLMRSIARSSGVELRDVPAFREGLAQAIDGLVAAFNSLGVFRRSH